MYFMLLLCLLTIYDKVIALLDNLKLVYKSKK